MNSVIQSFDLNSEEDESVRAASSKAASFKPGPPPIQSQHPSPKIELEWVNKVMALLFAGWKESAQFTSKVSEALERSANKDLPHYLGKIAISEFRIDGQAP